MFKKIFKIFLMILLILWMCGLLFNLYGNFGQLFSTSYYTAGVINQILSLLIILLALIKNNETKVFLLGFWPILALVVFELLSYLKVQINIPNETFFVSFLYIGFLLQLLVLGHIVWVLCLLLTAFFVYIRPAYMCESKNLLQSEISYQWNWMERVCEEKRVKWIPGTEENTK